MVDGFHADVRRYPRPRHCTARLSNFGLFRATLSASTKDNLSRWRLQNERIRTIGSPGIADKRFQKTTRFSPKLYQSCCLYSTDYTTIVSTFIRYSSINFWQWWLNFCHMRPIRSTILYELLLCFQFDMRQTAQRSKNE